MKSWLFSLTLLLALSAALPVGQAQAQIAGQAAVPAAAKAPGSTTPAVSPSGTPQKNDLVPEVLNAKAFLESLLIRRYSGEIGTRLSEGSYSVGARITLVDVVPEKKPPGFEQRLESDLPADLMLGSISPEELLRRYEEGSETLERAVSYLRSYRITAVEISAGLKPGFDTKAREELTKWLTERVTSEFGAAGKALVTEVKLPQELKAPKPEPTPWERLSEFQGLAGNLALALAFIVGAILFALLQKKGAPGGEISLQTQGSIQTQAEKRAAAEAAKAEEEQKKIEDQRAHEEIREITAKIQELMPRLTRDRLDRVVRSWCMESGSEGTLKLACFADSLGKAMDQLPIPTDSRTQVAQAFTEMPSRRAQERADSLRKGYWDVLTAIHLGTEVFEKPFDYLVSQNVSMIEQVLIEQNPRMKAIVTLFMPKRLRDDYLKTLGSEEKEALLLSAAGLSEIETTELKGYEGQLKDRLKPVGRRDVVPLEMALGKLVSSLTPMEEIQLLSKISREKSTPAVESYKRSTPSLAFLPEWSDEQLSRFLGKCMPDEITVYLRALPEAKDRIISLSPPMTADVVSDDLERPDPLKEAEKNEVLIQLQNRLRSLIDSREVDLQSALPEAPMGEGSERGGLRAVA